MAQIVVPLVILGTAYLISNKDSEENNEEKEGYQNTNYNMGIEEPKFTNINGKRDYTKSDVTTNYQNKYFTNQIKEDEPKEFVSLTGETMNSSNLGHNNMTPYHSNKMSGPNVDASNINESVLDNYLGNGTYQIEKTENAPLFSPENNVQNVYGVQNANDFYQSRVIPSQRVANVKPWEEERVAPGLNQGYNTEGSGGFNSGMGSREEWKPKTVDELRTSNNKKQSFSLNNHQGPALNPVKEVGKLGTIEKRQPDTYYMNNPDRWFTTTSDVKGNTNRAIPVLSDTSRSNTSVEYYGARGTADGNSVGNGYVKENYDLEREKLEQQAINDKKMGEKGIVTEMNKEIYKLDQEYDQQLQEEIDRDNFDMGMIPDDGDFDQEDVGRFDDDYLNY